VRLLLVELAVQVEQVLNFPQVQEFITQAVVAVVLMVLQVELRAAQAETAAAEQEVLAHFLLLLQAQTEPLIKAAAVVVDHKLAQAETAAAVL
jgi:hypothetical protein